MGNLKNKILNNKFNGVIKKLKRFEKDVSGKHEYSHFYNELLKMAIRGLNIGEGAYSEDDGEKELLKFLFSKLTNNNDKPIIFDVGANEGKYTKALYEVFNDKCLIYSFEPVKDTFNKLSNNNFASNIFIHNFGFSSSNTISTIYKSDISSGLSSLSKRRLDHFNINMDLQEEIKLITIDEFCKNNNIDHISFLKMDVEGHEIEVLKGAERMLNDNKIYSMQFEFGGCNIDSRTFFQDFWYLLKDKYDIYRITKNGL